MRIPFSWLQEYLGSEVACQQIETTLTSLGIEVDAVEEITPSFSGVLTARVEHVEAHPQSDRLRIADVFDGEKRTRLVCGAPNCRQGIIVAFAPVGATLSSISMEENEPESYVIAPIVLRGVESHGMLCSEQELGLGEEKDTILELPENTPVGMSLGEMVTDTVFHISLTPNLGHCLSVYGIARELSAALQLPLKKRWDLSQHEALQAIINEDAEKKLGAEKWEIDLFAREGCPRYALMTLQGVPSMSPSPFPWRRRLILSGMRPVHAIVDALNLVMLEIGQPMHAFDEGLFSSVRRVVIQRESRPKNPSDVRSITLLDGTERQIPEGTLVIENSNGEPLALAGIMGGMSSSVRETTKGVVVESAYFDMKVVRRASKALDIHTESSKRFERGTDPCGPIQGLLCLSQLIRSWFPQGVIRTVQIEEIENAHLPSHSIVPIRVSRAQSILGFTISRGDVEDIFSRLSYPISWRDVDTAEVTVPSYRHDITGEIDLIEEVAKLIGFSSFDLTVKPKYRSAFMPNHPLYECEKSARRAFVSLGLQECVTCSLISPSKTELVLDDPVPRTAVVSVQNPMSQEQSVLRPSLLPGLMDSLMRNISFRQESSALFEIGTIFLRSEGKIREKLAGGVILYGNSFPHHYSLDSRAFDFYDMKGIWEGLSHALGLSSIYVRPSHLSLFHPGRQASLILGEQQIGVMGEIHPTIAERLGLRERVYFMEIDLQDVFSSPLAHVVHKVEPLPLYPSMERDWTVTLSNKIPFEELYQAIIRASSSILESVELVAIFSSEKLGKDTHNITVRMRFRDPMKTLEQAEVDELFAHITQTVLRQFHSAS